jgi:hypothetical protein
MKEETTDSLCARAVLAPATSGSSVPIDQKMKWQYTHGLLEESNLKEEAM